MCLTTLFAVKYLQLYCAYVSTAEYLQKMFCLTRVQSLGALVNFCAYLASKIPVIHPPVSNKAPVFHGT